MRGTQGASRVSQAAGDCIGALSSRRLMYHDVRDERQQGRVPVRSKGCAIPLQHLRYCVKRSVAKHVIH